MMKSNKNRRKSPTLTWKKNRQNKKNKLSIYVSPFSNFEFNKSFKLFFPYFDTFYDRKISNFPFFFNFIFKF